MRHIGLLAILALLGCSPVATIDAGGGGGGGDGPLEGEMVIEPAELSEEGGRPVADLIETGPEVAETDAAGPLPGETGAACESGTDCNSGFCIQTGSGKQCTRPCEEECPFDWLCTLYTPSRPDILYLCIPGHVEHCRPCRFNTDCWSDGIDGGQRCVAYGASGSFCGSACEVDKECPQGSTCKQAVDIAQGKSWQCVRTDGNCSCQPWHADAGAATACRQENEFGSCPGERLCLATGLSQCDALIPAGEECNGLDDDCDRLTDEESDGNPCFVTNQFGSCPGIDLCQAGKLSCQGDQPDPELCDGKDNDCDGQVDEGYPDTDQDGIADCLEADVDGDGIPDLQDNCPGKHNPTQADQDLDNFGDSCDADDDNDKYADEDDCSPLNPAIHPGASELCNGLDDNCNFIVDEGFPDADADGWKDCVDDDDDGDGSKDSADCAPLDPAIFPGAFELCDGLDNSCNGLIDEGFPDTDKDGLSDCADPDDDKDGVPDELDNCPKIANALQEDADQDTLGDLCDPDLDGDGIPNVLDNCPTVFNPGQADTEKDTVGDGCDPDKDNDYLDDEGDNCPFHYNPEQEDLDGDGIGDACESDKDGDGTPDATDCAPLDPSIYPGAVELCDGLDNNCNGAVDEGFPDSDGDGLRNCVDPDDDGDAIPDDGDCAPLDPSIQPGAAESCDGKDNDCNGMVDDGLGLLSCGKGECFHSVPACVGGKVAACDSFEGISEEICDGMDNDCNGLTDEGLGSTPCGLGVCHHTVLNCLQGVAQQCDPLDGSGQEFCDGLDNDCDGKVDEGQPVLACGQGNCFHTTPSCIGGVEIECNPFQGALPEVCDGVDNDCDGPKDEGLGTVVCGLGQCQHEMGYCQGGKVAICNPYLGAAPEICDLADNDCDGLIDEDLWPISCGKGECAQLLPGCVDGKVPLCDPMAGAGPELCDGLDNDCDGQIDEALGIFTCGKGICLHSVPACVDGEQQQCDPLEGQGEELCDGLDNDCDGESDPEGADGCTLFYLDLDGDGHGMAGTEHCLCNALAPYTAESGDDCDDDHDTVSPSQAEDCYSAADDNCSGQTNEGCTYLSCAALLAALPGSSSGLYTVDVDGSAGPKQAFQALCDMETDGGGWTLLMKSSSNSAYVYDHAIWTQTAGGSDAAPELDADVDYVCPAFYWLEGAESRLALGARTKWNSWSHATNTARNLANQARMAGTQGGAATCAARTNCGTEPIAKRPLGLQEATSASFSNQWNRFGYVNDVNGWGTKTRVGFTGDNDSSDSSDSIMGIGLSCTNACLSGSCTGAPHNSGSGFYLYNAWAGLPFDGPTPGWLWIR